MLSQHWAQGERVINKAMKPRKAGEGWHTQEAQWREEGEISQEMPTEHRKQMAVKIIGNKDNCLALLF